MPVSGGMDRQNYRKMHTMTILLNVYDTVSHMRSLKGDRIHTLSDGQRRLIKFLLEMGAIS